jgi:hypothetical protein
MIDTPKTIAIFSLIYIAMIANAFWEAYVEGDNPWDKRKLGWKIKFGPKYCLPAYHFFLFVVMWPTILLLPLVISGWNTKLFGILVSAYSTGMVIEDFLWFVVNPAVGVRKFNSEYATYYPWTKIGKFSLPTFYFIAAIIAVGSWVFLWR